MTDSGDSDCSDISEGELNTEIQNFLKNASLENTSTKKVIQALEKKLGKDLSSKRKLIDQLVMDYVNSLESEEEEGSASEEEEEEKPPKMETRKRGKKAQETKKKTPAKGKKGGGVAKRGKGSGYTRSYKLSPALSELVGATELPRHEVVKRVWAIIKERQLIDPNNRQFAICDKPLYKVIGTQRFYTFGMMKYLKNHFLDE